VPIADRCRSGPTVRRSPPDRPRRRAPRFRPGSKRCFARRVNAFAQKYSYLQKFGFVACCPHSGSRKRGVSRSSRHAGRTAVDAGGVGAKVIAGRATVSERVAHTTGAVSVRQNRVVLAPAAGVKFCGDASAQPGATVSAIRKATGATELVSPGRARHKPSNHCAGKAGMSRLPCMPLCICFAHFSHSGPRVPAGARSSLRPLP
jgi:hypothetical protein